MAGRCLCPTGNRAEYITTSPLSPPPHTNMGWYDERDGASLPYLTHQQQQQQQHRGHSPLFTQTLDLYRACVAAGQRACFSVEQRAEGEYISFSCKPPAAAATAAAAAKRKQKKKPNKRRVELQRIWQENRSSSTAAAAARAQQQPHPAGGQQQQQLQQQGTTSYSSILRQLPTCAASAASRPLPTQQTTRTAAAAAVPMMETRSSKKRKVALSPAGATGIGPALPATPTLVRGGIPQSDGVEGTPTTPMVLTELDRMPTGSSVTPPDGTDGSPTTVPRMPRPPYQPTITPPPMSEHFPKHPYKVICYLCLADSRYTHYTQCETCHYRCPY